ncbi:hypothetical protein JMJ55_25560 [Belnapia sp. T6]|uniref:Uncharacterized protein n=1 Tax=Belnapia mucosa TaxID=2804532 RepID=A0ABS1VC37_9PROT|nr:hypothetical protein [Belnapia mucosa]MBL6458706.1 hypothetical protein [Belnapia mucosa]
MRSFEPRSGQSGDFVAAALAAVIAELQPGWIALQDCLLDGLLDANGVVKPARIPYILLHGQVGIALLDFVPGNVTPNAAQRLKLMLEDASFTARYGRFPPIIYLCIPKRTVPGLALVLEHEFRKLAPLALPRDATWTRLVQRLLAGERDTESPAPPGNQGRRDDSAAPKIRRRAASTRRSRGSRWRSTALGLLALAFGGTVGLYAATPLESRLALLASSGWDGILDRLPWLPGHDHAGEEATALLAEEPPRFLPVAFAESLTTPASEEAELPATAASPPPQALPDETLFAAPLRGADPPAEKLAAWSQPLRGGLPPDASDEGQADGTNGTAMAAPLPEPAIRPAEPEVAQPAGPAIPVEDKATEAVPVSIPPPPPSVAETETQPAQAVAADDPGPAPAADLPAPRDDASALTLLAGVTLTPDPPAIEPGPGLVMAGLTVIPADLLAMAADTPPIPAAAPSQPDDTRPDSQAEPAPAALAATGASPALPAAESSAPGPTEGSGDLAAQHKPEAEPEAKPSPDLPPPQREVADTPATQPVPLAEAPVPPPSPARQAEQPRPVPVPVPVAATIPAPVAPQAVSPAPNPAFAQAAIQRGDAMMRLGDISAARLLYQRAATAGSGPAALALGRTYDPAFLAANRAQGILGDRAQAANWYRRALALGTAEARDRLAELGADEGR